MIEPRVIKPTLVAEQLLLKMPPIESVPNEYCLERSQRIVVGKWHAKFDELPRSEPPAQTAGLN